MVRENRSERQRVAFSGREGKLDRTILKKLEEWREKEGQLPGSLELYEELLRIQVGAREILGRPRIILSRKEAKEKIRKGVPLVSWDTLSIDWPRAQDLFRAASNSIRQYTGQGPSDGYLMKIEDDAKSLEEISRSWFVGSSNQHPETDSTENQVLAAAIHCALRPILRAYAEALEGLVDQELWRRGYCPICGGKPDFACLDAEGARWLLCSRCDSTWLFRRLECPYCGNTDQDKLGYKVDEEGQYRLYLCMECHTYLKAIDQRHTRGDVLLPLERAATGDLDRQGQEEGYQAG